MTQITNLSAADKAAIERLNDRQDDMVKTTIAWSEVNTGSHNLDGLKTFAPRLADAFSVLSARIDLEETKPFDLINTKGETEACQTGPIVRVKARAEAPIQIIMSGHYDTVFPKHSGFDTVTDLGGGRLKGPGLTDMKGGICIMLEALKAFEKGPLRDQLGYQIVLTPDEEIGNLASAPALTEAARSGAMIGMTYEPCMEDGAMSGARKGSAIYDIIFKGRAAHAGRAHAEGRSAIRAAARFVSAIEDLNGQYEGVTINTGQIDGGGAVNIVPDLAIVRLGARGPDSEAANWLDSQIQSTLSAILASTDGLAAHVHGGFYRPPKPRNAAQSRLFTAVHATGKAIGLDLEFRDTGGVCEGNNIFAAGVPNVDTLGVQGGRIHSAEEYVITDSFAKRAAMSVLLLNRLADGRIDAKSIKALMS